MENETFSRLVIEAVEGLPVHIRSKIDNVAFCIEDRPTQAQLHAGGVRAGGTLLGLYEGVPQIVYARGQMTRLPDKITIFKKSLERFAHTPDEMKELVRETVWHEIAHHFGFDEKSVRTLERKRAEKKNAVNNNNYR